MKKPDKLGNPSALTARPKGGPHRNRGSRLMTSSYLWEVSEEVWQQKGQLS